jgi:hypothetical protein
MLTRSANEKRASRNLRRERRLWHDGHRHTGSLGCMSCPENPVCGGLHLIRAFFDCLNAFCCRNPAKCDVVCRNKPDAFVRRFREVGGFTFDNVPRAPVLPPPPLPFVVPVLYHDSGRLAPFRASAVCLSLYKVVQRHNGSLRYQSPADLARGFAIAEGLPVILTGTDRDGPVERWWSLGQERREVIQALRGLGIALATTPNYSLFTDQPRWDDLHSMKRIAITHEEFLRAGVPAALHVNARTERDWERWTMYIAARPEITHVAFEFSTGAGHVPRIEWHAAQLVRLAAAVERPLHLVVRGGLRVLMRVAAAFSGITVLETSAFMRATHRQRAVPLGPGKVTWQPSPTETNGTIDALLVENWNVVAASYAGLLEQKSLPEAAE